MIDFLIRIVSWLVLLAGGLVALRAVGADGAPGTLDYGTLALNAASQHPDIVTFVSALFLEFCVRRFPTWRPASVAFLAGRVLRFAAAVCTLLAKVCETVGNHPFAQVVRAPAPPAAAPPAEQPKDPAA